MGQQKKLATLPFLFALISHKNGVNNQFVGSKVARLFVHVTIYKRIGQPGTSFEKSCGTILA